MIIKPSISYASLHISKKSVVNNREETLIQIETTFKLTNEGIFIEKYLSGHEYTVLVIGNELDGIEVFPVLERIFNSKLQLNERLLTFENKWSGSQCNGYDIRGEKLYYSAPVKFQEQIQLVARNAYIALNGNGYGRVDIRTDDMNNTNIYVLEVNANCSIGYGHNTTVREVKNNIILFFV
jgi:D-alanine-D-alanine ligase-like ATP-grasp enzyme